MPLVVDTGPEHAPSAIDAAVDDEEIVVSGEAVFVDEMTSALLPVQTDSITVLEKASKSLIPPVSFRGDDRIVVFRLMQMQEVGRGEILLAFPTAIGVRRIVVSFVVVVCGERQDPVGR
jgi:hypothetical protein